MSSGAAETSTGGTSTDGRRRRGERTREAVLIRAADIASVDGLEGLSIGRLATDLGVSKAGVFTHFGSKEALQLATIGAAVDRYAAHVVTPAFVASEGLSRVWELCDRWLAYARSGVFPGGCFFFNVAAEFDARPGPVRDAIAEARRRWLATYEAVIETAKELGHLAPATEPEGLAFELDALGMAANLHATLLDDLSAYDTAKSAMLSRLRSAAADPSTLPDS